MAYIKEYWESKKERAVNARKHTEDMNKKYASEIASSIEHTKVYSTDFGSGVHPELILSYKSVHREPSVLVDALDSVSAIASHHKGKTAVLNFASYKNPGGMFIEGSKAQEECLCHESFLYNVLKEFDSSYYELNRRHKNRALYLNRGLYSPGITFEHDFKQYVADVITVAAPNFSAAEKYQNVSNEENHEVLRDRIRFVLDIAADNRVDTLILGAYGCGVFGQDPFEVASIFKGLLESDFEGVFENVVFAVPDGKNSNLQAFRSVLEGKELERE